LIGTSPLALGQLLDPSALIGGSTAVVLTVPWAGKSTHDPGVVVLAEEGCEIRFGRTRLATKARIINKLL